MEEDTDRQQVGEERERPGGKKGRLTRVVRVFGAGLYWLWVGALGLLLVACIIFRAPWKAVLTVGVLLLGATALPRRYRKWYKAAVIAALAVFIVWVFLPDESGNWRPYVFEEEAAALQAKYAVPDEENAALIYEKLREKWVEANESTMPFEAGDKATREPWKRREHPDIAAWIESQDDIIDGLREASTMKRCSFPITTDSVTYERSVRKLSTFRQWALLLETAVNNDIAEGRIDAAIEKLEITTAMARHLHQQPAVVDSLMAIAIETPAVENWQRIIVNSDDANGVHLGRLDEIFSTVGCTPETLHEKERPQQILVTKNMFAGMLYEVNDEGEVRLSRDPTAYVREQTLQVSDSQSEDEAQVSKNNGSLSPSGYWGNKLMKASVMLAWFYAPASPEELSEIVDSEYKKAYDLPEPDPNIVRDPVKSIESLLKTRWNFRDTAETVARFYGNAPRSYDGFCERLETNRRGNLILLGLRRYRDLHGSWPERLDELGDSVSAEMLVDPMNGHSFVYKVSDDGFVLYSKGPNGIDENGEWGGDNGADDWMIWPVGRGGEK
jgi:hypothetical protein